MQARTPSSALPVPPSVAKMARAVLLSSGKGVVLRRFCRDYRELSFEVFPWRKLGYASAADMLQAMPAVVRFTFSQKDGDYKLYGVADKDVFNPSWFLKHEFKGNNAGGGAFGAVTSLPPCVPVLAYNAKGLVSLHVTWHTTCGREDFGPVKKRLRKMVQGVAAPVEIHIHKPGSAYVRFETIEEAQRVLQSFGTAEVDGVMYAVAPAREGMPRGTMKPMLTKSPVDRHDSANSQQWNSPPPGGRGMQASGGRGMLEASTIKPSPPLEEATPTCPPLEEATPTCPLLEEATPTCPPLEDSTSGSEVSDASTDEWDETLLERLSLQGSDTPTEEKPHSRFPGIPNLVWDSVLPLCSGTGGRWWGERFGGVARAGQPLELTVTHVASARHFWARLPAEGTNDTASVEWCLRFLQPSPSPPPSGAVCAAYSHSRRQWRRCWHQGSSVGTAKVLYIDEGCWAEVPTSCLSSLPAFAAALPMAAVPCVLSGLQLKSLAPESLRNGSQQLSQLIKGAGTVLGRLILHQDCSCLEPIPLILESPELGGSINDAILSTGFVSLALPGGRGTAREHGTSSGASGDNREHTASSWQLSPPGVPNEHGLTPVVVSEVVSPDRVWLQLGSRPADDLLSLSDRLRFGCQPQQLQVVEGDVCSVSQSGTGPCHRRVLVAAVTTTIAQQSKANVLWIDTGKSLSVSLCSLRSVPPSLLPSSLPPLAIPCALEGLQSTFHGEGKWFPLDIQLLWKYLLQKKLYARFTCKPSAEQHCPRPGRVGLYFDPQGERRVTDTLAREGFHLCAAPADQTAATCRSDGPGLPDDTSGRSQTGAEKSAFPDCPPLVAGCGAGEGGGCGGAGEGGGYGPTASPWQRLQLVWQGLGDHES